MSYVEFVLHKYTLNSLVFQKKNRNNSEVLNLTVYHPKINYPNPDSCIRNLYLI